MFKCYSCDLYMIKPQLEEKQGLCMNPDLCQIPIQDGTESALECMQCLCFHVQWEVDERRGRKKHQEDAVMQMRWEFS